MSKTWFIESGDLKATAKADGCVDAFVSLVKSKSPKSLGLLVRASLIGFADDQVGDESTWYFKTETVLEKINLMSDSVN